MSIPDVTGETENLIKVVSKSSEPVFDNFFQRIKIQFEVSRDAVFVTRSAYTLWAVLGDVGGLNAIIFSLAASIASIFAFNRDENYLASLLFVHGRSSLGEQHP